MVSPVPMQALHTTKGYICQVRVVKGRHDLITRGWIKLMHKHSQDYYRLQWILSYPKWLGPTLFQIYKILICTYNDDIIMGTCTYMHVHITKLSIHVQCTVIYMW